MKVCLIVRLSFPDAVLLANEATEEREEPVLIALRKDCRLKDIHDAVDDRLSALWSAVRAEGGVPMKGANGRGSLPSAS